MEIGGVGGGRERMVEEKFEVVDGGRASDVKSDGFTSQGSDLNFLLVAVFCHCSQLQLRGKCLQRFFVFFFQFKKTNSTRCL